LPFALYARRAWLVFWETVRECAAFLLMPLKSWDAMD